MSSPSSQAELSFERSCDNASSYPLCLIRSSLFEHSLEVYRRQINELQPLLFHPQRRIVFVRDLKEDTEDFVQHDKTQDLPQLKALMNKNIRDPQCRYIFIQSPTNRSALGCTQEQLEWLLTYNQVMPSFLDLVLTFQKRQDASLMSTFRHENYLGAEHKDFGLPHLGRSGLKLQHCFNLHSVEHAPDESLWKWPMRQAAAYHSFDVGEGRSLWIVIKGNKLIRDRIEKATKAHPSMKGSCMNTMERRFVAALMTHLILFEWCAENWRPYIDDLESQMKLASIRAKGAKVKQGAKAIHDKLNASRPNIASPGSSRQNTVNSKAPITLRRLTTGLFSRENSDLDRPLAKVISGEPTAISPRNTWTSNASQHQSSPQVDSFPTSPLGLSVSELPSIEMEKWFDFEQLQRLSFLGEKMDEAHMIMEQNQTILREVREHYQAMLNSDLKPYTYLDKCRTEIRSFFQRVRGIERDLEMGMCRLKTLSRYLENDKNLIYGILSYHSAEVSKHFAISAQQSTDRMELWTQKLHTIAEKTEQETVSMHVITVFTLLFLPGTFLAVRLFIITCLPLLTQLAELVILMLSQTFFSSGVLKWDENGQLGKDMVVRHDGMKLFFQICIPITVITIGAWTLFYRYVRKRKIRETDEEAQSSQVNGALQGRGDEKGNGLLLP